MALVISINGDYIPDGEASADITGLPDYALYVGITWVGSVRTIKWYRAEGAGAFALQGTTNYGGSPSTDGAQNYYFTAHSTSTLYRWYVVCAEPLGDEYTSDIWSYTTEAVAPPPADLPDKATNPTPANAADDVTLDQATITWEDGGGATSYNVYYGENEAGLALVSGDQAGLSFTITDVDYGSPFEYLVSRTWRIDSINADGETTGDVWTFSALAFDPPLPTGVTLDGDGLPTGTPTGESNMLTVRKLVAAADSKIFYEDI